DNLITQAQGGDIEAFNALVLEYQNYIFTITYRVMGDSNSAADAAQDTFITAFRKLDSYRGGNFRAWLARIATNTCYDELRKRKRRPQDYLEDLSGSEFYDEPPIAADTPNPEQEAERSDLSQLIQDCINGLNDDQRMVIVLSDIQGYAYQEIADQVNASLGTVKSRLSRARLSVRRCLQSVQELLPTEFRLTNDE
ncbi:MAG: sigma-70 family RNA polymerase sigma factor, partial [Phototrophicaceae bacterium]